MDPVAKDVRLQLEEGGSSYIQRAPANSFVLSSVEDKSEDKSTIPEPTGPKCKRHTVARYVQINPALEAASPFLPSFIPSSYPPPTYIPTLRAFTSVTDDSGDSDDSDDSDDSLLTGVSTKQPGILEKMDPLPELPSSSDTTNNTRVWESHRPSNLNFPIHNDPAPQQQAPSANQEEQVLNPHEADKENLYVSQSDLDSSSEEDEDEEDTFPYSFPRWTPVSIGPRDAFGLPLNREMSDLVQPQDTRSPERPMRHGREVLQPFWVDDSEVVEQNERFLRDGILTEAQLRDIEYIESMYQRGHQSRARSDRHQALRDDAPVQASTNFNTDVRRVLHFPRHEGPSTTPEDNPVHSENPLITPEEDEDEFQQENQEPGQ